MPWHHAETYLEYLRETLPGGMSRSDDDAPVRPVVDEEAPAPQPQPTPMPAGPEQGQRSRIRLPIKQVARFGAAEDVA